MCVRQVLALDVADEVEVGRVEQLGRALDAGVALALLLADRQERDARLARRPARARRRSRPSARTGRGSPAVESGLAPMSSSTNGPLAGDHLDGERRAVDAGQPARGAGPRRPCPAPVWPAVTTASASPRLTRSIATRIDAVLLLAQGERRVLVHADDLARVDDRDVRRAASPAMPRMTASSPTRITRSSGCARAWSRAPGTTSAGPWSPPIASTATRTPAPSGARRSGPGCGHRVSARRRRSAAGLSSTARRPW